MPERLDSVKGPSGSEAQPGSRLQVVPAPVLAVEAADLLAAHVPDEALGVGDSGAAPALQAARLARVAAPVQRSLLGRWQAQRGNAYVQRVLRHWRATAGARQQPDETGSVPVQREDLGGRIQAAAAGGRPLAPELARDFGVRLGADLSGVRIHTGSEADSLNRAVDAVAFTSGQDIFFSHGTYAPASHEGRRLLAHELAHTVQQAAGPVAGTPTAGGVAISDPGDAFEQAAERAAGQALAPGGPGSALPANGLAPARQGALQRQPAPGAEAEQIPDLGAPEPITLDEASGGTITIDEQGVTNCNYNAPSLKTKDEKITDAGDGLVDISGTIVATYKATITVTLPTVPSGLSTCQRKRVQDAIDKQLKPHEDQHVAAFKKYDGVYEAACEAKGVPRKDALKELVAAGKVLTDIEGARRKQEAQDASDKLDTPPFIINVDLDCDDKKKSSTGEMPPLAAEGGGQGGTPVQMVQRLRRGGLPGHLTDATLPRITAPALDFNPSGVALTVDRAAAPAAASISAPTPAPPACAAVQRQAGGAAPRATRFVQREDAPPAALLACPLPYDNYAVAGPTGPQPAPQGDPATVGARPNTRASGADFDHFERVWMTSSRAQAQIYFYQALKQMWLQSGPRSVDEYVDRFTYRITLDYGARAFKTDAEAQRALMIGASVMAAQKWLHDDGEKFVKCFEQQATEIAKSALDESEERVMGEVKQYFGSTILADFLFGSQDDSGPGARSAKEDAASRRGLGIAAEGIARRRNALIKANAAYRNAVRTPTLGWSERKPIEDAHAAAARDFEVFRLQVIPRFPILEEFTPPELDPMMDEDAEPDDAQGQQLNTLAQLAQGDTSEDAIRVILGRVTDKIKNIAKVREELKPDGEVNIWRVPKIVEVTRELTGAKSETFQGKLVEDKINEKPPRSLTGRLIEYLEIGLYVAALFTEGLTLIPAAMLTTARVGKRVYEHWMQYQTQKALAGTDFGAAALTADDPSLFWLGADIAAAFVEVGLSVVPAVEVFRVLAPMARLARAAKAGEEAVVALEVAAREVTAKQLGEEKAAQFAARVAADARASQGGGVAGMTADEAKLLAQADAQVAAAGAERAGAAGLPVATTGPKAGLRLPVGATLPAKADQALGVVVESKLAKAGATETLQAARSAMRNGNTAEAERLFAQVEKHLTAEESNLIWRELGQMTKSATRAEQPITLFGERHTLKLVQGEEGAYCMLCSWCTRVQKVLEDALKNARAAGTVQAARASRLEELIKQVGRMEENINAGLVTKSDATGPNTLKWLLAKLSESEHLLATTLPQDMAMRLRPIARPDFTKLARDPAVASRAADLYPEYLEQLYRSREGIFRVGKKQRDELWAALEEEAMARALTQAQRGSARGAPLELAPDAPARAVINPGADIPYGFYDRPGFDQFSRRLYTPLRDAETTLKNARPELSASPDGSLILEGSSISGRRYERLVGPFGPTGAPFGVGRMSDYDVAIVSDALLKRAKDLRFVAKDALESQPLTAAQLKALGLSKLDDAARAAILDATGVGFPVKFKLRSPSAPASGQPSLPLAGGSK